MQHNRTNENLSNKKFFQKNFSGLPGTLFFSGYQTYLVSLTIYIKLEDRLIAQNGTPDEAKHLNHNQFFSENVFSWLPETPIV